MDILAFFSHMFSSVLFRRLRERYIDAFVLNLQAVVNERFDLENREDIYTLHTADKCENIRNRF
jgi:hypothetical protein